METATQGYGLQPGQKSPRTSTKGRREPETGSRAPSMLGKGHFGFPGAAPESSVDYQITRASGVSSDQQLGTPKVTRVAGINANHTGLSVTGPRTGCSTPACPGNLLQALPHETTNHTC